MKEKVDLSEYPLYLIRDGILKLKIVIGAKAPTSDVVGAIDIAASLQAELGDLPSEWSIPAALAILDSDLKDSEPSNLIVVGSPEVNLISARLFGFDRLVSKDELEKLGFEKDKGLIKMSVTNEGRVIILVAGYDAPETLGCCYVLANYRAYDLQGTELEVVVKDLDNLRLFEKEEKTVTEEIKRRREDITSESYIKEENYSKKRLEKLISLLRLKKIKENENFINLINEIKETCSQKLYSACVILCGTLIENILKGKIDDFFSLNIKEEYKEKLIDRNINFQQIFIKKLNFYSLVEFLEEIGDIDKKLAKFLHEVRTLRNAFTHHDEEEIRKTDIFKKELQNMLLEKEIIPNGKAREMCANYCVDIVIAFIETLYSD